ncbi:hypothetical protein BS47DRAFT_1393468 [Hydnum rufescens UP504]|uniref:Uncharacterized protein n=1 Tax=Hydnum rufescens UP504 TaxID=1448309 RepID=A0A9P6DVZ9_9AGAM|nr:hypothetical protein BS47DRAFT_1393468 [Hydnum rufescens UP504]
MSKPSYFALVGIETLTLQELLACWARRNGLSPMDWTNPLEPESPPSSGPSPLLNSDTTELTLVECVRTPSAGPYRTAHGLNSAPSSSFCTPPDANIHDSNLSSPLSSRVDTSRRVVTPLNLRYGPSSPCTQLSDTSVARQSNVHLGMQSLSHHQVHSGYNMGSCPAPSAVSDYQSNEVLRTTWSGNTHHKTQFRRPVNEVNPSSHDYSSGIHNLSIPSYETIQASLHRSNKFNFCKAMNLISTWLNWLLYDLNVDSSCFLSQTVHESSRDSVRYKLDTVLAHPDLAMWIPGPKWELNPGIPIKDEPRVIKTQQPRSRTSGFNEWFDPSTTARLKSTDEAYHYGSRSPSGYRGPRDLNIPLQPPSNSNMVMDEEEERNHLQESYFHYEMVSQSCPQFGPGHTKPSRTYEDVQELTRQPTRAKGPNAHEARPKQRARLESSVESITRNSVLKVSRKTGGLPRPHLQVWTNVAGETIKVDTNLLRTVSPKDARHLEPVARDVWLTCPYRQKDISPTKPSAVRGTAIRIMFASRGRTIPKLATGQSIPEYRDIRNDPYKSKPVPVTGDRLRYLTVIRQGVPVETGGHHHSTISDRKIDVLNRVPIWLLVQAERSGDSYQAVIMVFQSSHSFPWPGFRNPNQLGVQIVLDETRKDLGLDPQDNETVSKGPEALTINARKPYSDILTDSGPLIPIRAYMTLIHLQGARKGTDCLPFENGPGPSSSGVTADHQTRTRPYSLCSSLVMRPENQRTQEFVQRVTITHLRRQTDSSLGCGTLDSGSFGYLQPSAHDDQADRLELSINSTRAGCPIETKWKRDIARFHQKFNLELGTKDNKCDVRPTGSSLQVSLQPLNGVIHPAYEGTMDLASGFTTRLLSMSVMVKNPKYLKDWSPRTISKGLGELGITSRNTSPQTEHGYSAQSLFGSDLSMEEPHDSDLKSELDIHRYYHKDPELDPRSNKTRPGLLAPTEALSLMVECRLPDIDAAEENELLSWNSCLQAVQSGVTQLPPVGPNLLHDLTRILENNLADLTLEAVIEYCSSRRVYKPFDTFMSEFSKPIPKNFEPLQMYRNTLKDSGQQAWIEVLNLHTSRHQLSIVMTKNNRRLLRGCGQQMEEYDTT